MCLSLLIDIGLVQAVRLPSQKWIAIGFISIAVMYVFSLYSPLTYGIPISNKAQCERLKLRSGWDWDCNRIGVTLETATGTSVEKPIAPVVNKDQFEEEKPADHTVV